MSTHPHPPIKNVHPPPFTQNIPLPTNQEKNIWDEIKLKLLQSRTHTYLHDHCSGDLSNTPSLWGKSLEPYRSKESSCIFCLMVWHSKPLIFVYFLGLGLQVAKRCGTRVIYQRYGTTCFVWTTCRTGVSIEGMKQCFTLMMYGFYSDNSLYSASFSFTISTFDTWDCY